MNNDDCLAGLIATLENLHFRNNRFLLDSVQRIHEMKNNEAPTATIAVTGEFSTGKSTFINAIVKEKLLQMRVRSTTNAITEIKYGRQRKVTLQSCNAQREFELPRNPEVAGAIGLTKIQIEIDSEVLRYIKIVDTPGFNSGDENHTQITLDFIKNADIVFWVFDAIRIGKQTELQVLSKHCTKQPLIAIINKIDQLEGPIAVSKCRDFFYQLIAETGMKFNEAFFVSARDALHAQGKFTTSGMPQVLYYLSNDVMPMMKEIRRKKNLLALREVVKSLYILYKWLEAEQERYRFNSKIIKREIEHIMQDKLVIDNTLLKLLYQLVIEYYGINSRRYHSAIIPSTMEELYHFVCHDVSSGSLKAEL